MNDLTGTERWAFYLAYVHPAWMLTTIALAAATLRAGLVLRRARLRGTRRDGAAYRRHLRLAKPTVSLLVIGFGLGLGSALWLRGWGAFATAHGLVATTALGLFLATGWLGRRMERGDRSRIDLHALLGGLSTLAAVAAFLTGFVLLP